MVCTFLHLKASLDIKILFDTTSALRSTNATPPTRPVAEKPKGCDGAMPITALLTQKSAA